MSGGDNLQNDVDVVLQTRRGGRDWSGERAVCLVAAAVRARSESKVFNDNIFT